MTAAVSAGDPVVAEVVRNGFIESRHHGRVVALDADGKTVLSIGAVTEPMFPRSSLKPVQATALLAAGWRPGDDEQVALACASHSGEQMHVDVVRRILTSSGLDVAALQNTPDLPLNAEAARALLRAGEDKDPLHQNCSGKHAAMLATCVANGWSTATYRDPEHPVQLAIRGTIEELCGESIAATAVDGCGTPLFAISLVGLARAFARLAMSPVADAMRARPDLVGGAGRDVTAAMRGITGLVAKDGAEGVYAAALPDGRAVALKVEDGGGRARGPVLAAALERLGVSPHDTASLREVPVFGHGERVGCVRAVVMSA